MRTPLLATLEFIGTSALAKSTEELEQAIEGFLEAQ